MSFARIKGELTSRIGRRVRFGPPKDVEKGDGGAQYGTIIDEVWADPMINRKPSRNAELGAWGDYSFAAQLIEWDGEPGSKDRSVRFVYFRRRAGEDWSEYAAQTTLTADLEMAKLLLEKTLAKVSWFEKGSTELTRPNDV